jgi:hypothetical protein
MVVTMMVAAATIAAAAVVSSPGAQAAPGPFQDLKLPGVCNSIAFTMAEKIDAKLKADGKPDRMIRVDEPKKGETGFYDAAVAYAVVELAKALKKEIGDLTAKDLADNAQKVADAVDAALKWRADKGDTVLHRADLAGNEVYLWCLKAGNGHGGPDLGLLYVPKGKAAKDGVWIAGCVLPGGLNAYQGSYDDKTFDFAKFVWYNEGPNPGKDKEFIRYTYEYDVAANILKITKEVGPYKQGVFTPHTTEVEKKPGPPPTEFKDLKLNGVQISLLDGGCACPAQQAVVAVADPATPWQLDLANPVQRGTGGDDLPAGVSVRVAPHELFTVALPEGARFAGPGADPRWEIVSVQDSLIAVRYRGYEPLVLGVGAVVRAVAWIVPAPTPTVPPLPTPSTSASPSPTQVPTPTEVPSPTSTTQLPSPPAPTTPEQPTAPPPTHTAVPTEPVVIDGTAVTR